jgi:signal transduction histidine kinase
MIRGTLDIDSRPGRGTELRIEIPIEAPIEEAQP